MSKRSTVDHVVLLETFVREAFIKKEHLTAVLFDLEKAYDTWKYGIMCDRSDFGLKGRLPHFIDNLYQVEVRVGTKALNPGVGCSLYVCGNDAADMAAKDSLDFNTNASQVPYTDLKSHINLLLQTSGKSAGRLVQIINFIKLSPLLVSDHLVLEILIRRKLFYLS